MVFARNDVAPRGGKAPQEVERDVYDQPMVFARRDRPTSDGKAPLTGPGAGPSSPKPRGLFGKLFGGSKAGKSTGSSNDFQQVRLDRPKPAPARPGVRLESSGPPERQDALNRFTGALADFMGSEIADKHKRSVEAAVLHSNSSGALKKALAAAAYLNVDERQLAAVTGLAKANKDLKGDLTDVEVILRRN
jgi:hypothetical protein